MREDEPGDLVHEVLAEALFPDHPLGRDVLGDEERVQAMSRDDIHAFWAEHYRPRNMVFAAAGRLEHDALVDGIARRFDGPTGGERPVRTPPSTPPVPTATDSRPTEQAHVAIGMRALDREHPDRYALSVLDQVLGGGLSSRLFQTIREERGLAYSVYSYRAAFEDGGALAVYAGTGVQHVDEVLGLMHEALDKLAAEGITARELEVARGHLVGELALSLEDSAARMHRIGRSQLVHGCIPTVEEVVARVQDVTLEQVADVAARVLGGPRTLAVVGPFAADRF